MLDGKQYFDCGMRMVSWYVDCKIKCGGSLSAARIKVDYDMIKNRNFLSCGPVESGRGAE